MVITTFGIPNNVLDEVMAMVVEDNNGGICTACHEVAYGVEPDAEGYECESCGALAVCGAEQFLLMNVP
jgi:hypothetical protein